MFSFIFTLGTSPISWSVNRQSSMETSSTKAKYRVMTKATKETMRLRYILIELKLFKDTYSIKLLCDNQSNIKLANNHVFHYRTKHVRIQYHFIREKVDEGMIDLHYLPINQQSVDIFTKPLSKIKFEYFKITIGVISISELVHEINLVSLA